MVIRVQSGLEKKKIQENAEALAGLLNLWASPYPLIRAWRIPAVASLVATALLGMELSEALLVGKLILFIFAINDLGKERLLSSAAFEQIRNALLEIARHGQASSPVREYGDLAGILSEMRAKLARYSSFPGFYQLWVTRLEQLFEATAKAHAFLLQDGANGSAWESENLPSLEAYIEGGIHSTGFPFWGTSVLILLGEGDLLDHLEEINELILQAATAIRLYFDARPQELDGSEVNISAVTLFQHSISDEDSGYSAAERLSLARQSVLGLADRHAQRCNELAAAGLTSSGQFEEMICRVVAFHANFNRTRRRTISSTSDVFAMIQGVL